VNPSFFQYQCLFRGGDRSEGDAPHRKALPTMKKKYFSDESVFEFIWESADRDGMWVGNAATLAAEFGVTEDEAHAMLCELFDRHRIQRLGASKYIITRWRERDDPSEDELAW
jgi:hypothetical protein